MMPQRSLVRIARRWRAERWTAWGVSTMCTGVAAYLAARDLRIAGAAALLPLAAALYNQRRHPITAATVAQHLNRRIPALEESAELLLEEAQGGPMQRLQRRRAAAAIAQTGSIPRLQAPLTHRALAISVTGLLLAALVLLIPARTPADANDGVAFVPLATGTPLQLRHVRVQWTPPSYLGRAQRTGGPGNVVVEEGSVVQWQVDAAGAAEVRIIDLLGDTLVARRVEEHWVATTTVTGARVWRAEALDGRGTVVRTEAFLLGVTPDRPPVIAIVAPPGRTEMEWDEPHRVVIRAAVSDDHAIGTTTLLATVAAGRGEGVRFRERRLPLERESSAGPGEQIVSALLDLDALDVAPGDEVYLAVEATDRRAPTPQVARSETVFLAIRDTLEPVGSDFGGVAIDIEPEFFRSQRQIILDTEALLAEVRARRNTAPLARAMEIGYDQYLLRVRYGEIAGQEDEANGTEPDAVITEADLMHQHDTEDNATRLAATVKATLQDALAAMWEAEKQLRTGHPAEALPHEYRALVALEQIRQAQRAYVKRIGFEPPAIDVARTRLTKDAKDTAPLDRRIPQDQGNAGGDLRAALDVLDAVTLPGRLATLDAAARQLASQALRDVDGRHLETLGALRQLIDGTDDLATRARVRSGLLAALPAPPRPIVPVPPQ